MTTRLRFAVATTVLSVVASPVHAQVAVAREGAEALANAVLRYLGKESASEAAEQLAKLGGREGLERVASRTLQEGGEQALRKLTTNVAAYGPDYVIALKTVQSPQAIIKALDDLPPDAVRPALRALGSRTAGASVGSAVEKYGAKALQAEVRCEGVGARLVETLGDEGYHAVTTLARDEAITLGRYADDIARLPDSQKSGVLQLLHDDGSRMAAFMGRFLEKNPGKVLFTSAAAAVLLTNSERLLGGDEIVFDSDGNPIVAAKRGFLGRLLDQVLGMAVPLITAFTVAIVAWLGLRLFFIYKHEQALFQARWGSVDAKQAGRRGKGKMAGREGGPDPKPDCERRG